LLGQTVKSLNVNGLMQTIDISDIPTGNYLVVAKMVNGQQSVNKIVKK